MITTQASLKFIAVHLDIKKRYASNYPEVIKPYIKILRQIMDSNHISVQEALQKINNSSLVQAKQVKDPKKQQKKMPLLFSPKGFMFLLCFAFWKQMPYLPQINRVFYSNF